MGSLLVAFVISFTVAGSVALGVLSAYGAVTSLLNAFARISGARPRLVLVASENQAGGD